MSEARTKDRRLAAGVVKELWSLGHQTAFDGASSVHSEATHDVLMGVLANQGRSVDDGSMEARDPEIARALSQANPGWWGWQEANITDATDSAKAPTVGILYWRYEQSYLCHVVLVRGPDASYMDVATWYVHPANDSPTNFHEDFAIRTGEEFGVYETFGGPTSLVEVAKAACVKAALQSATPERDANPPR